MFRSKRNRVFIHRYQLENIHALTLPKLALALHIFLTLIFTLPNFVHYDKKNAGGNRYRNLEFARQMEKKKLHFIMTYILLVSIKTLFKQAYR